MRVKCTVRPTDGDHVDTQLTAGKFYDVLDTNDRFGITYYTVVGDDGIEIERPHHFFRKMEKKRKRTITTIDGREVDAKEIGRGPARVLAGKCNDCEMRQEKRRSK